MTSSLVSAISISVTARALRNIAVRSVSPPLSMIAFSRNLGSGLTPLSRVRVLLSFLISNRERPAGVPPSGSALVKDGGMSLVSALMLVSSTRSASMSALCTSETS